MSFGSLRARDLMTTKVYWGQRGESLRTAVARLTENGAQCLLIEPESPGTGYCILTGKDCIEILCEVGEAALDDLCVEDAMTRPAVTVPADFCVLDCMYLMRRAGVRAASVLENERVVGLLTFGAILRGCIRSDAER